MDLLPREQGKTLQTPDGTVTIWVPRRGLLVTQVAGKLSRDLGQEIDVAFRRVAGEVTAFQAFHDWEAMTDYDQEVRIRLTNSSRELKSVGQAHHILVGSRVVAFGIQAASLILSNIQSYSDRPSFEKALKARLTATS
jgi:hypothetical protein